MPFKKGDRDTARKGGRASGRWKDKDPETIRKVNIMLKVSPGEAAMINKKAADAGLSKIEFLVRAAKKYNIEE